MTRTEAMPRDGHPTNSAVYQNQRMRNVRPRLCIVHAISHSTTLMRYDSSDKNFNWTVGTKRSERWVQMLLEKQGVKMSGVAILFFFAANFLSSCSRYFHKIVRNYFLHWSKARHCLRLYRLVRLTNKERRRSQIMTGSGNLSAPFNSRNVVLLRMGRWRVYSCTQRLNLGGRDNAREACHFRAEYLASGVILVINKK